MSNGSWSVNEEEGYGIEEGTIRDIPSLQAPGVIMATAQGRFNDASAALSGDLILKIRSNTPDYPAFRVSFGTKYTREFKAKFFVPPGEDFSEVRIPFNTFSDYWDHYTGDQMITCAEDPRVCPTTESLANLQQLSFWAQGANGYANLEIKSVSAGINDKVNVESVEVIKPGLSNISDDFNICMGNVQKDLLYGMDRRTTSNYLPVRVDEEETLAEAVCCDSRMIPFAEPQYTYSAPDIRLFSKIDHDGITTFYDSVCGLPLFRAPVGRTFEEFEADTTEHGWPSFREQEVITENVVTDKSQEYVFSNCGTHLGSYLPDEEGDRWCIDLACISGKEKFPTVEIIV